MPISRQNYLSGKNNILYFERITMAKSQIIYARMRAIFPDTTSRSFSRDCGRSDGYLGSITAQKMEISINALIHLLEVLEQRKRKAATSDGTYSKQVQRIQSLQDLIATEIAERTTQSVSEQNLNIRQMIIGAVARLNEDRSFDDVPAILI